MAHSHGHGEGAVSVGMSHGFLSKRIEVYRERGKRSRRLPSPATRGFRGLGVRAEMARHVGSERVVERLHIVLPGRPFRVGERKLLFKVFVVAERDNDAL